MAFTFVESIVGTFTSGGTATATMTMPVASGDLLVAIPYFYATTTNLLSFLSCSDTTNTGGYAFPTQAQIYAAGTGNPTTVCSYIKCNAAGTPTVSMVNSSTLTSWQIAVAHYTCSNSNPAFITTDSNGLGGTGTTANATGFTNSSTNELTLVANVNAAASLSGITAAFITREAPFTGLYLGELITATSGNAIAWTATLSTTATWGTIAASFSDAGSAMSPTLLGQICL
jgi:hypothetical protein